MYPEVQLPSPNGSLGHTRGQVNCAMARSKALTNAGMPVYFVWSRKFHISNGTAKSVGSHSVCPTPDVMAFPLTIVPKLRTCIPHTKRFEDRASVLESLRMRYTGSCVAHNRRSKIKMSSKVAAGALIFTCTPSYTNIMRMRALTRLRITHIYKDYHLFIIHHL